MEPPTHVSTVITFTPEMVTDDTAIDLAEKLDQVNFYNLLKFLDQSYHHDTSLVSDKIYDQLVDIYESQYGPYKEVGAEPTGQKADLPYYLGSLKKVKEEKDLNNWLQKHPGPYILEDKIDGLTLLLTSKLDPTGRPIINLYTRGGGTRGTDVSHLAPYLNLPNLSQEVAIRGEIVMTKDSFARVGGSYKNARNLTSGIVNSKKQFQPELARELTFYAYHIPSQNLTPEQEMITLQTWGFRVPFPGSVPALNKAILVNYLQTRKAQAPYEIDGIVIYQNLAIQYPKGKDPSHVIAFKIPSESSITTVTDVIWEASKHRLLKPVIHYQPISLSGAILQKASGYNARFIISNNIGPGAKIEVTRSGDVIPRVIKVISPSPSGPKYPDSAVQGKYDWNSNQVEFVLTEDNNQVIVSQLESFLVKLGVKGFGPERIKSLVQTGIKTIGDLIRVKPDQLTSIRGIGPKTANQLRLDLDQKLKGVSLATLMAASGIFPNIGERRFEMILDVYPTLLDYAHSDPVQVGTALSQVHGIQTLGIEIAKNLARFDNWLKQYPEITLKDVSTISLVVNQPAESVKSLSGMTIVFSGFRDKQLEGRIKERGGKVTSAVSRNTSLLIMKDVTDLKGKGLKAQQLGIPLLSREEFERQYLG